VSRKFFAIRQKLGNDTTIASEVFLTCDDHLPEFMVVPHELERVDEEDEKATVEHEDRHRSSCEVGRCGNENRNDMSSDAPPTGWGNGLATVVVVSGVWVEDQGTWSSH
jgi:hypothetical protein